MCGLSLANVLALDTRRWRTGVWVERPQQGCDKTLLLEKGPIVPATHAIAWAIVEWTQVLSERVRFK